MIKTEAGDVYYEATGIDPDSLGVRREDDPVAYKKAYSVAYRARNKQVLAERQAAKYAAINAVEQARREAEKQARAKDKTLFSRIRREARAQLRELDEPERLARKRRLQREAANRRRTQGAELLRDKRLKPIHWANRARMAEVFREGKKLQRLTEVPHHVDHVYPICGKSVCGLHNEFNLRAVTKVVNQEKSNSMPGFLAGELWDPFSSDVYYDGELYTQAQRRRLELDEAAEAKKAKQALDKAERRRLANLKPKVSRKVAEPKKRGRKPMTKEQALARPDVQALLAGASIREVGRRFGSANNVKLVAYARIADPEYRSPYHKHGRPQK